MLLWGHSHAGNVFALVTNLLAGDRRGGRRVLQGRRGLLPLADRRLRRHSGLGCASGDRLQDGGRPASPRAAGHGHVRHADPLRLGLGRLRPAACTSSTTARPRGLPEYRAPFPPKLDDVLSAADGDYIQQLGIAGTNVMPSIFSWRSWLADNRLNELLQHDLGRQKPTDRFQAGAIVPDEGTTLLVDYGPLEGGIAQHLAGHAVYTSSQWLLFHAEETVRRFYE